MTDEPAHAELLEARIRLAGVAEKLAQKFGGEEAARMFQGCVLGILTSTYGLQTAKNFLIDFTNEVLGDDRNAWPKDGSA